MGTRSRIRDEFRLCRRPWIVVSRCLTGERCRYNGKAVSGAAVRRLARAAGLLPVCPELEIGLGVPRAPIRIISIGTAKPAREGVSANPSRNGALRLVQSGSGRDVTARMRSFADSFLSSLGPVAGFILKSGSPSCGLCGIKVYSPTGRFRPNVTTRGLFAGAVREKFPDLPVIDEKSLASRKSRADFLRRIRTHARPRRAVRFRQRKTMRAGRIKGVTSHPRSGL